MYNPYIDTEGEPFVTKSYGENNENLKESDLTEIFVVCYTIKKKGQKEPEEVYSFTTDFDQAFKRFKLLPNTKCFLKRFMTDDDELIRLAKDGTKPKPVEGEYEGADLKEILDKFRDEDEEGNPIYETEIKQSDPSEQVIVELEQLALAPPSSPDWEPERDRD